MPRASPGVSSRNFIERQTALAPFPPRFGCVLEYGLNIALPTVGSVPYAAGYRFRLNSLYDPDASGIGGQPYYRDQIAPLYSRYMVTMVDIELDFVDPTASGLWVGYSIRSATTTGDIPNGLNLGDILSRRMTFRCKPLNKNGTQSVTFKERVPLHTLVGLTAQQFAANVLDFGSTVGANPTSELYLELFVIDPNSLVSPQYVLVGGTIGYHSTFWDYNAPAAS